MTLDQTLAPLVALDDLRLRSEPRCPQLDLAGLGLQRALVMAGPGNAARASPRSERCALHARSALSSNSACRELVRGGTPSQCPGCVGPPPVQLDRGPPAYPLFIFEKRTILNARTWFGIRED